VAVVVKGLKAGSVSGLTITDGASVAGSNSGDQTLSGLGGLPLAAGAMTGNIDLAENGIKLKNGLSATGKWSGIQQDGTAGATLTFGQLCYLNSSGKWVLAKADSSTTSANKLGICILAAAGDTSATTMLLYGNINWSSFPTLTVGAPVYISGATAGAVVVAQPTTMDYVIRVIGFANAAAELFFSPSPDYMTHT